MTGLNIVRQSSLTPEALDLLAEYYDAAEVVQRDSPEDISALIGRPNSGLWLAYQKGVLAGCVLLRELPSIPAAAECKRLYVRPASRRSGVAGALMDAVESFARSTGLAWVYLDTYDGLASAIALYQGRGYELCERFNNNPQATIFLRKRL